MATTVYMLVIYDGFDTGSTTLHTTLEGAQQQVRAALSDRHGFDTVRDQEEAGGFDSLRTLSKFTIETSTLT